MIYTAQIHLYFADTVFSASVSVGSDLILLVLYCYMMH